MRLRTGAPAIWIILLMEENSNRGLLFAPASDHCCRGVYAEKSRFLSRVIRYGMVGFIKELVDEQGVGNIALGRKGDFRLSKFKNLLVTQGIVFVSKTTPTLRASPNLVPAGEGRGKTTISWNSVDGKIYVSADGGDEPLFAGSSRGSQDANWIREGSRYEFRLYNADHTVLLEKVVVTKATR